MFMYILWSVSNPFCAKQNFVRNVKINWKEIEILRTLAPFYPTGPYYIHIWYIISYMYKWTYLTLSLLHESWGGNHHVFSPETSPFPTFPGQLSRLLPSAASYELPVVSPMIPQKNSENQRIMEVSFKEINLIWTKIVVCGQKKSDSLDFSCPLYFFP